MPGRQHKRTRPLALRPRWHRRLSVRIGATVFCALLVIELALQPLGQWMAASGLHPWTRIAVGAALAVAVSTTTALSLARWVRGRLDRLAFPDTGATSTDALPGPFDASGGDEIAQAAATMNALRSRVEGRLNGLNLQDIRRREWIAQVSHDLRTPLTAQLACLDRAMLILEKSDSPLRRNELRELLSIAKADANRVHTLADDLLEIARLEAGDRLRLEPVPPGELGRQAARRLEPLAAQKGIRLDVTVATGLPLLHADGRRLTRAVENLLRNALQHGRSKVEIRVLLSGDHVRFEVRDDGRGLPKQPDFLDYLRRRSSDIRLSELARRRKNADSAGLGLVVAQRVAEAHDGTIDAFNLTSGGAAFWLAIPVPHEDPSLSSEPDHGTRRSQTGT